VRILLATHYALPHLGGIEVAVDAFARELSGRGHEVSHLSSACARPGQQASTPAVPFPEGLTPSAPYRTVRLTALNSFERRLAVPYPIHAPALWPAAVREVARADVVHAHGYLYMSTVAVLAAARRDPRRPLRVLTEHVGQVPYESPALSAVQRAAAETVGRWSARAAEGVVVLNQAVERELARLAPDCPRMVGINGVDRDRHRPARPGERSHLRLLLGWDEGPHVLFVGRLVARKGLEVVLDLAVREPKVHFVVAGPGRPPGEVPANVTLLGPQSPERVGELFRAADVFVLPSRGEGFPVTAQEAMATGLPVLLGDDGAYGEVFADAAPGLTLLAPSAEAFSPALRGLIDNREARAAAGRFARAYATQYFAWGAVVDRHLAFYEQLVAERAPEP